MSYVFFFQAEDGIRDYKVTGVQTCALPILLLDDQPDYDTSYMEDRRVAKDCLLSYRGNRYSVPFRYARSEERRVGKSVDLGGRRIIKKKKKNTQGMKIYVDK